MNQTIKSLVGISLKLRNLKSIPPYFTFVRLLRIPPLTEVVSNSTKSLQEQDNLKKQTYTLWSSIRKCKDEDELLNLVNMNHTTITSREIVEAFSTLHKLSKDQSNVNYKKFEPLYDVLQKNVQSMTLYDLIECLKTLTFVKVPSTTHISQLLYERIQHSINDLNLQQISFIDFLIHTPNVQSTPLTDALTIALPVVFETQLNKQLDRDDISSMKNAFEYLTNRSKNKRSFDILFDGLTNFSKKIPVDVAVDLFFTLKKQKEFTAKHATLLQRIQKILFAERHNISSSLMVQILHTIGFKKISGFKEYYHEGFVDACAERVVSEDLGFQIGIEVLKNLCKLDHVHYDLLDYMTKQLLANSNSKSYLSWMQTLLAGLSMADYKSKFLADIEKCVEKTKVQIMLRDAILFALYFTSLNCYSSEILALAFIMNLKNDKSLNTKPKRRKVLVLYQSVKALYPQYNGPWPEPTIIKDTEPWKRDPISTQQILSSLEKALGGPRYIYSNLRTKLGHYIDYAIVLRKGGYPVASNLIEKLDNEVEIYVEDLSVPKESQIILILNMPDYTYTRNTKRLKGVWKMFLKSLEAESMYTVCPINTCTFLDLNEHERIPYLMEAINSTSTDYITQTNII